VDVHHTTRKHAEKRTKTTGASIIKTPKRVKHNRKNWLHQYKQGGRIHDTDKWTTPQERKKNNNNFKDEILKTNYFKQSNFNECQCGETAV
jgi:hypothetical protein